MPTSNPALAYLLRIWQERRQQGDPVTPEELCSDAPELLDPLKAQIAAIEAAEHAGLTLTCNGPPSTLTTQVCVAEPDPNRTMTMAEGIAEPALQQSPPGYEFLA